ncbi:MAG: [FeFe] hydrogenase H-cluster radical SAM maturase HydG [candidate division WOR-3 bacterium]|nr:[FeFe] hydrogenase H-cluster radical SAM maturase HydG [candidate division WOR-3 bacterium]MCX7837404.1 [FeFe] hydrogenase H-cluster radical SAM maturase HydG [candidate division WOR-3 bacterium]MDW8113630.1 [FeFe] hydrogenase H-cluster radical SAM maturase HydG [candidate division WOR-3 bacterium]
MKVIKEICDEEKILQILEKTKNPDRKTIELIFNKAKEKKGLSLEEVGYLTNLKDKELISELFNIAGKIKDEIYGERLVFFAPLYISDFCVNDCEYCNFHIRNPLKRRKLSLEEIKEETIRIIEMGHKRVLLECGEDPINNPIDYIVSAIETIYSVKTEKGNIRRVNVNISATTKEDYKKLKEVKIGTYQLFQETYHYETYKKLHKGPKSDYERQITAHIRAFEGGIDDLGIGVLFGLYDWRFEVLSLVSHSQFMDKHLGIGPHTISVPRFREAPTVTYQPAYPVSDEDFLKIIAILRVAVPYTGMILSTRERPEIRKIAFKLGISQTSAGSRTSPGGYKKFLKEEVQFEVYDLRNLEEVISDILEDKLIPSFCTACYRIGRTGENFMNLAKPGEIHKFCRPNGILTFVEYLENFAKNNGKKEIYEKGYEVVEYYLNKIDNENVRKETIKRIERIKKGERDLYF